MSDGSVSAICITSGYAARLAASDRVNALSAQYRAQTYRLVEFIILDVERSHTARRQHQRLVVCRIKTAIITRKPEHRYAMIFRKKHQKEFLRNCKVESLYRVGQKFVLPKTTWNYYLSASYLITCSFFCLDLKWFDMTLIVRTMSQKRLSNFY